MVEHPVIVNRSHSVQWKREVFDLDQKKLATLKASHGWTNADLARHFRVSVSTIKVYLYDLDRTGEQTDGCNKPNGATPNVLNLYQFL